MTEISDEMLTAYLDGEAKPELTATIEAAMETDASLAARLEALAVDTDELRRAFDGLLEVAPPPPDLGNVVAYPARRLPDLMKIAATGVLALGLGWFWGQSDTGALEHWQDYAAAYHRLYVNDTLEAADFTGSELAGQLAGAARAIGLDMSMDQMSTLKGLTLKRVQVLGFKEGKIAHLAFVDEAGNPVALCISDLVDSAPDGHAEVFGMATAAWSSGQHSFYLIGGENAGLVEAVAGQFAKG